ncbi:MAG: hypothetical protein ACLPKZ_01505 [Acidimicrobiales bacterium]
MDDRVHIADSSHEQRVVIARAYDHFHATGVWPTFGQMDRPLYVEEQIDVVSVLRSIPNTLVLFDRSSPNPQLESPIQLRLAAIASCVGSESDLDLYFTSLRWFAAQERLPANTETNEREVSRQELLNFLSTTKHGSFWINATKVISLVLVEGSLYRSTYSQDADGEWKLRITRNIRGFENVHNLDAYDKAMASLLTRLRESTYTVPTANFPVEPTQPEIIIEPETMPETAPDRFVFVIMPFQEPWSDATYELIKAAIELVPGEPKLRALRSDEIDVHGDITNQIIEAIEGATLVLADVTSSKLRSGWFGGKRFVPNANVMWELGYSMAQEANEGAPNVLISKNAAQAPFDLAHLRQLTYSIPTNETQIKRLATMITANLPLPPS